MYPDITAVELADQLEAVRDVPPDLTGPLALLDEASLSWTLRYPQLTEPHRAFAEVRGRLWPHSRTETTWNETVTAASALADGLRELGDIRLERCSEATEEGPCNRVLREGGRCAGSHGRLRPPAETGTPA
ncbi:hypothetical protein [Streptomyces sp. CAU 1734]|uniref:hypothetical protein n=1 Tax=Streptomyces sp. CAU 1734 TaxID=3140360 RepID=UPI0032613867